MNVLVKLYWIEWMNLYKYEEKLLKKGHRYICGCDEVGRGPLAGPVVAAAVVLDPNHLIEGLNDSKQLSERRREQLAIEIKEKCIAYNIQYIDPEEIDRINIYQASKRAMMLAVLALDIVPSFVLSDAMPLEELGIPFESIIKGDTLSASIAAASIIAKVERDEYMRQMSEVYPGYGFEQHKGYPTKQHLQALDELGVCPIHRKSYKPVQDRLNHQFYFKL